MNNIVVRTKLYGISEGYEILRHVSSDVYHHAINSLHTGVFGWKDGWFHKTGVRYFYSQVKVELLRKLGHEDRILNR